MNESKQDQSKEHTGKRYTDHSLLQFAGNNELVELIVGLVVCSQK
jgi:hypothetical protein